MQPVMITHGQTHSCDGDALSSLLQFDQRGLASEKSPDRTAIISDHKALATGTSSTGEFVVVGATHRSDCGEGLTIAAIGQ